MATINLESGDCLNIPDDCTVSVENNIVLVKKKELEFKKGDFVACKKYSNQIVIFADSNERGAIIAFAGVDIKTNHITLRKDLGWGYVREFRLATEEEKQILIEKLHEAGKDWDAEKLEVVDYGWKPKIGEMYYFAYDSYESYKYIPFSSYFKTSMDNSRFLNNQCFKTLELCQSFCDQANELLKNAKKY